MPTRPTPFSSTPDTGGALARRRAATPWALRLWLVMAWLLLCGATPTRAQSPVPASVLGQPVQQVAGGKLHTCALTTAGAV
ncbi:MAG: hypothetical protein V4679_05985, partial [Pseudomonadota bacterium]